MEKILENTYRNINIGMINELAMLCNEMGISIWEVIEAASTKPYGFQAFYPGPGLGGHCIPLDPYYLSWKAREYGFHTSMIESSMMINDKMPAYCVERAGKVLNRFKKALNGSKVLVLGVAYKQDIDDYRESPALRVIEELEHTGAEVVYFDPWVRQYKFKGQVRDSEPELTEELVESADLVMVTAAHTNVDYEFVQQHAKAIFDTKNVMKNLKNREIIEMKYALIGCGRIATNHVKAVVNNKLEFAAVCDVVPEQMEALLAKHGLEKDSSIARYTDYKKMIEEVQPELVGIATESGIHAEIALYCIDHGVNCIIEKPIAMSMEDADEIVRRSEEKHVKVAACHQNRFNIAVQEARKALEAGRFGKLSHGAIHVRWNRNQNYYDQAPWRGKWASDGGALMNQCIHGIDLLRWMFGDEVEEVYGSTRQQFHHYLEAEDIGMAIVKFKNGAIGTIEGTTNVYPKNLEETLYMFGEHGTVKLGGTSTNNIDVWAFEDEQAEDAKNQNLQEATSNVYGNGHTSLYADVIDAIEHDRQPYVDAVAGRNALEMVLAIYKSQKDGVPVKLPLKHFKSTDMAGEFDV